MTMDLELAAQMTDLTQELASKYGVDAQRDPTIPAGTVLSEVGTEAGVVRELKQNSMVRLGNQPLPPRFEAWDVYGRPSQLPMAQMTMMLTKPNAERPNVRAFHLHRGGVTRSNCTICPPEREPFAGSCIWCNERTGGVVEKKFESEDARDRHVRMFHPNEAEALERRLDRDLQREGLEMQRKQAEAMASLVERVLGSPPALPPDPVAAIATEPVDPIAVIEQEPATVNCPDCGLQVKAKGLNMHQLRWCRAKAVAE